MQRKRPCHTGQSLSRSLKTSKNKDELRITPSSVTCPFCFVFIILTSLNLIVNIKGRSPARMFSSAAEDQPRFHIQFSDVMRRWLLIVFHRNILGFSKIYFMLSIIAEYTDMSICYVWIRDDFYNITKLASEYTTYFIEGFKCNAFPLT